MGMRLLVVATLVALATPAGADEREGALLDRIAAATVEQIDAEPALRGFALARGAALFATDCASCHGPGGVGREGVPVLTDDDWLWGDGTLPRIERVIRHGIRDEQDPDTLTGYMPAFGADGTLTRPQIEDVAQHILSLTGRATDAEAARRGARIFAQNCAPCHGAAGQGDRYAGVPRLNDDVWLYSGTLEGIEAQDTRPRHGVMPAWQDRLGEAEIKMVAVYVHSLGGGH